MVGVMFGTSSHNTPKPRKDEGVSQFITCLSKQHSALLEGRQQNPAYHQVHSPRVLRPIRKLWGELLPQIQLHTYQIIQNTQEMSQRSEKTNATSLQVEK